MTKWGVVLGGVLVVASAVSAYRFGLSVARQAAGRAVTDVQLMLSFDHMKRYEELRDCLRAGKAVEAEKKLSHDVTTQRELVASLLQMENGPSTLEYIRKRSDTSLDELRSFRSDRGSRWTEPACDEARGGS